MPAPGITKTFQGASRMTAQSPERILIDGVTHPLFSDPLYPLLEAHGLRFEMTSTACWRGYIGTWQVMDGKLQIVGLVRQYNWNSKLRTVDPVTEKRRSGRWIAELLPDEGLASVLNAAQCTAFPIPAVWFSGRLRLPMGQRLVYVHMGWGSRYESERVLTIERGVVVRDRIVDTGRMLVRERLPDERLKRSLEPTAEMSLAPNAAGLWDLPDLPQRPFAHDYPDAASGHKAQSVSFATKAAVVNAGSGQPVPAGWHPPSRMVWWMRRKLPLRMPLHILEFLELNGIITGVAPPVADSDSRCAFYFAEIAVRILAPWHLREAGLPEFAIELEQCSNLDQAADLSNRVRLEIGHVSNRDRFAPLKGKIDESGVYGVCAHAHTAHWFSTLGPDQLKQVAYQVNCCFPWLHEPNWSMVLDMFKSALNGEYDTDLVRRAMPVNGRALSATEGSA